jgi:hypothetical protein
MRYARRSSVFLWLCALLTAMHVDASPWDSLPTMDVVRSKLELTPEQETRLRPLFDARLAELQDLRTRLERAPTKADKRIVMQDAKHRQQSFNASVESLLTPSQKNKWKELRDQTREKLKQKYEDKRESGG